MTATPSVSYTHLDVYKRQMTLIATWVGVLSKGILTNPSLAAYGGSVDNITPRTIISVMGPFWAGVTIIGPVAATISTVSSLLLTASSSIIKDVYMQTLKKNGKGLSNRGIQRFSMAATTLLGTGIYLIAIAPPSVIWKINMLDVYKRQPLPFFLGEKAGAGCPSSRGTICDAMILAPLSSTL